MWCIRRKRLVAVCGLLYWVLGCMLRLEYILETGLLYVVYSSSMSNVSGSERLVE